MTKLTMREYLAKLETRIDLSLKKWKKESRIENGAVVQCEWQFELSHVIMDVFWMDDQERIVVYCLNPYIHMRRGEWWGLTPATATYVMDKIGNFAMVVQNRNH